MNEYDHMDLGALGGSALMNGPITSALGEDMNGFFDFLQPKMAEAKKKPTLARGSQGAEVAELQQMLGVAPDGIFGPGTEAALKQYQSTKGLPATGVTDVATWAALLGAKPGAGLQQVPDVISQGIQGAQGAQSQTVASALPSARPGRFGPGTWRGRLAVPQEEGMSTTTKVALGVGAVVVVGGLAWWLYSRSTAPKMTGAF
jgi:hypothetical protein